MGIENIRGKRVGYIRVSQSIPLSQRGQVTVGGYVQRMAILRLLEQADCKITFLSDVRGEDEDVLKQKGWGYNPVQLDFKDDYDILVIENAATHNLFFSKRPELKFLPLVRVQDQRIATFRGERIYWQCLDPAIIRGNWSSLEDQERLGKMTTVWHGALKVEPYKERLANKVYLFRFPTEWKFFTAQRFNKYLPINPVSKRNLTITYLGSMRSRLAVFKEIYYSKTLAKYDVNIVGKAWTNEIVAEAPSNVKFWEPIPQWGSLQLLNQSKYTIIIGDGVYNSSTWTTTRNYEGLYGNCIMLVSDRYAEPEALVFDKRLIVDGNSIGKVIEWLESQNYVDLIMKQRMYLASRWYFELKDEYAMF